MGLKSPDSKRHGDTHQDGGQVMYEWDGYAWIKRAVESFHGDMSDQEIRARALECAVRWLSSRTDALESAGVADNEIKDLFWGFAKDFENYIRGKS